jgi:ankyrin repeat protein
VQRPLFIASTHGHARVVRLLLARGARLDARESHGMTALMGAVHAGHVEAVGVLMAAVGAGLDHDVDELGDTVVHLAAIGGHIEVRCAS